MFYDVTGMLGDMTHDQYVAADERGDVVEIWNDVFMEYQKKDGVVIGKLTQKNVDTGSGLERISMIVQGKSNVYEADMFAPVMAKIKDQSKKFDERAARIVADHTRSAMFLIADGVLPGSKDQGYILRRLIRRAVMQSKNLGLATHFLGDAVVIFTQIYEDQYSEVKNLDIEVILNAEEDKFAKTLESGIKEFEKNPDPFILATTYGFPVELTEELAQEKGIIINRATFDIQMKMHQDASRAGAEGKFKGGLANTSEIATKLHTAHHLLLKALQEVVSADIHQKGSNITEERLRIDFSFERKMTDEEKAEVEKIVNDNIEKDLKVIKRVMPKEEAEQIGAEMEFGTKYENMVSVYFIEDENGDAISKESHL
jgi:alanyl-tRNA synthetase